MRSTILLGLLLLFSVGVQGQIVQVGALDSTLMNVNGGSVRMFLGDTQSMFSFADVAGKPAIGASFQEPFHGFDLIAGDQAFSGSLGSDFAGTGLSFSGIGLGVKRVRQGKDKLYVFVGRSSLAYGFPEISAATPTGGVWVSTLGYERSISERLTFYSVNVASTKLTSLQSVSFKPVPYFTLAGSAGIGNNSPYLGGMAGLQKRRVAARASYAKAGKNFTLLNIPNQTTISNGGLNAQATMMPWTWLSSSMGHTQYTVPAIAGVTLGGHSTLNSLGSNLKFKYADAHADFYQGSANGSKERGKDAGAGLALFNSHLIARSSWYKSEGFAGITQSSLTYQTSRFSVTQYVTQSQGKLSMNWGGSYTGNMLSVSVGYSEQFQVLPGSTRNPYTSVLAVQVAVRVKDYNATVQTVSAPGEQTKWSAYGGGFLYGPLGGGPTVGNSMGGKYVVAGSVLDEQGAPVEGAAILIGTGKHASMVWTDTHGKFESRQRKKQYYAVAVSLDDFQNPAVYVVRECPASANVGETVHIIVVRQ